MRVRREQAREHPARVPGRADDDDTLRAHIRVRGYGLSRKNTTANARPGRPRRVSVRASRRLSRSRLEPRTHKVAIRCTRRPRNLEKTRSPLRGARSRRASTRSSHRRAWSSSSTPTKSPRGGRAWRRAPAATWGSRARAGVSSARRPWGGVISRGSRVSRHGRARRSSPGVGVVLLRLDQRVVVAKLFRLSTFFIVATRRLA